MKMENTLAKIAMFLTCTVLLASCGASPLQKKKKKHRDVPSTNVDQDQKDRADTSSTAPQAQKTQPPRLPELTSDFAFSVNQELVSCLKYENRPQDLDCQLRKNLLTLAPRQNEMSDFTISYNMTCRTDETAPRPSEMIVSLEGNVKVFLNLNDSVQKLVVGRGFGPLVLEDLDPGNLANLSFKRDGCSLKISEIAVTAIAVAAPAGEDVD